MRWRGLSALLMLVFVPAAGAWTWPVQGPVLQTFSFDQAHPYTAGQHRGIAIGAGTGATVLAPAAGIVSFAGSVPTNGQTLTILTPSGLAVSLTHLGSIAVAEHASLDEGAPVGTVGPSGTPEFDVPYVHLGVRDASNDQGYLDPLAFLPVLAPPAPVPAPAPAPVLAPAPAPPAAAAPAPVPAPPADVPAPVPATQPLPQPVPAPVLVAPQPVGAPAPASAPAPVAETPPASAVPVSAPPAPLPGFPLQAPFAAPEPALPIRVLAPSAPKSSLRLPALTLAPSGPSAKPKPVTIGSTPLLPALPALRLPNPSPGPLVAVALRRPSALRASAAPAASPSGHGLVRPLTLGLAGVLLAAVLAAAVRFGRRRRPPTVRRLRAAGSAAGGRLAA